MLLSILWISFILLFLLLGSILQSNTNGVQQPVAIKNDNTNGQQHVPQHVIRVCSPVYYTVDPDNHPELIGIPKVAGIVTVENDHVLSPKNENPPSPPCEPLSKRVRHGSATDDDLDKNAVTDSTYYVHSPSSINSPASWSGDVEQGENRTVFYLFIFWNICLFYEIYAFMS